MDLWWLHNLDRHVLQDNQHGRQNKICHSIRPSKGWLSILRKKKSIKQQDSQHASKPNNKKKKIWNRMEQEKIKLQSAYPNRHQHEDTWLKCKFTFMSKESSKKELKSFKLWWNTVQLILISQKAGWFHKKASQVLYRVWSTQSSIRNPC